VGAADDRRHVVLAVRLEADVAQQHHLIVALDLLEGALQQIDRIHRVALEEFFGGFHHALWRAGEPLARRIVTGPADQRFHRPQRFVAGRALQGLHGLDFRAPGHTGAPRHGSACAA